MTDINCISLKFILKFHSDRRSAGHPIAPPVYTMLARSTSPQFSIFQVSIASVKQSQPKYPTL
ncbi:MAG: hypothetical protein ACRC62_13205 [Microcoleus sp.]